MGSFFTLILAVVLGSTLAYETKKVTSESQRKRIVKILNIFEIGMVLIIFTMIRPQLPKQGFWTVFHSKEELAHYKKVQDTSEQIKQLQEEIQKRYRQ